MNEMESIEQTEGFAVADREADERFQTCDPADESDYTYCLKYLDTGKNPPPSQQRYV